MTKKIIVVFFLVMFAMVGCGQDGDDGESFIAYSWLYGPISFYSEDPAFTGRSTIYSGQYYRTRPGSWYMEYFAWDDSYWWTTYSIYVDKGESAELFSDGDDGDDLYFELACYSIGPSLYVYKNLNVSAMSADQRHEPIAVLGVSNVDAERKLGKEQEYSDEGVVEANTFSVTVAPNRSIAPMQTFDGDGFSVSLRYGRLNSE